MIAELSGNHGHRFERAIELVHAAKAAGADAIKLQTYTADTITLDCDNEHFRIKGTIFDGRTLHDLYAEAHTPWEWHAELQGEAARLGMHCFSSPFDSTAVDFLEGLGMPIYKIASFELNDLPLLRKVASTGKPVILSTGMATLEELDEAVATLRDAGCAQIALLKCTSAVPAPFSEMNLRAIPMLSSRYGVVAGVSDHSSGTAVPVAAVALGASIVEKHLKLSKDDSGPDVSFSLDAGEFASMVAAVRAAELSLGDGVWKLVPSDESSRQFRRSLFVCRDIQPGEVLTLQNVRSIRPGTGLHTRHYAEILGRSAVRALSKGTPLTWEDVGGA
ncbi:MAG: pseudaminic acid synthase [Chthoniobacterales bacterium]